MTAAPQSGTMSFIGLRSRLIYTKEIYVSDVTGALIRWDSGAGAGAASDTDWRAPEPVLLRDYAMITGTADTKKLQLTKNGIPVGAIMRYTTFLDSVNNRPKLGVIFGAGDKIQALQLA